MPSHQTFAMSVGLGFGHLELLALRLFGHFLDTPLGTAQLLLEFSFGALRMPVGTYDRFAAVVGLERPLVVRATGWREGTAERVASRL